MFQMLPETAAVSTHDTDGCGGGLGCSQPLLKLEETAFYGEVPGPQFPCLSPFSRNKNDKDTSTEKPHHNAAKAAQTAKAVDTQAYAEAKENPESPDWQAASERGGTDPLQPRAPRPVIPKRSLLPDCQIRASILQSLSS